MGWTIVGEAGALPMLADWSYDAVISSHVIEHLANPIKAIRDWHRLTRPGGSLLAVIPRRELGFDHLRPETPFDHIQRDYARDVGEDDQTHVEEVLRLHDVTMDSGAWPLEEYRYRVNHNLSYRVIHHHVFGEDALARTLDFGGFDVDTLIASPLLGSVVLATRRDRTEWATSG